jgi:hypothetical protein
MIKWDLGEKVEKANKVILPPRMKRSQKGNQISATSAPSLIRTSKTSWQRRLASKLL